MNYLKKFGLLLTFSLFMLACEKQPVENDDFRKKKTSKVDGSVDYKNSLKSHEQLFNKKWKVEDVKIVDGMMSFKDENELNSFISFLYQLKEKNNWLDDFEKQREFKSLRSHYVKQLDYLNLEVLDKDDSEAEKFIYDFVEKNSTYWRIDNKDSENAELVQNYDYGKYYLVANESLQLLINGKVRAVLKDLNDGGKYIYENTTANKMATCGLPRNNVEIIATKNVRWCKNDRRVKLEASISFRNDEPTFVEAGYNIFLRGQKKVSCIWMNYKTDLDVTNASAELSVTQADGTELTPLFGGNLIIPDFSGDDQYSIEGFDADIYLKPPGQPSNVDEMNFIMVQAEGTSRGMSGIMAVMDCEI